MQQEKWTSRLILWRIDYSQKPGLSVYLFSDLDLSEVDSGRKGGYWYLHLDKLLLSESIREAEIKWIHGIQHVCAFNQQNASLRWFPGNVMQSDADTWNRGGKEKPAIGIQIMAVSWWIMQHIHCTFSTQSPVCLWRVCVHVWQADCITYQLACTLSSTAVKPEGSVAVASTDRQFWFTIHFHVSLQDWPTFSYCVWVCVWERTEIKKEVVWRLFY